MRISNKSDSAAATAPQPGSGTISWEFHGKMGPKRRHFILAPSSSSSGSKGLKVGRDIQRQKLIEPVIISRSSELPILDGDVHCAAASYPLGRLGKLQYETKGQLLRS